jgi:hypothetical protein
MGNSRNIFIKTIVQAIDTGDITYLKPHLPNIFWQLYSEYIGRTGQKPDKSTTVRILLETLWGGCCG